MTFTVTLTTDSTPVEVYGGLPACVHYLNYGTNDGAVAFRGLAADDQARMLRQASLYIDAQVWQGAPTTPAIGGTVLQWPRSGVIDASGLAVDPNSVPINIVNAVFELAALFADDPDLAMNIDFGTNVKGVGAGSARVENFIPTSALDGSAPLLPPAVQRLVAQYLGSAIDTVGGGIVTGPVDCDDSDRHRWDRSWPF